MWSGIEAALKKLYARLFLAVTCCLRPFKSQCCRVSKEKRMEYHSPSISQEAKTTITDVVRWAYELARVHARIVLILPDRTASAGPGLPARHLEFH